MSALGQKQTVEACIHQPVIAVNVSQLSLLKLQFWHSSSGGLESFPHDHTCVNKNFTQISITNCPDFVSTFWIWLSNCIESFDWWELQAKAPEKKKDVAFQAVPKSWANDERRQKRKNTQILSRNLEMTDAAMNQKGHEQHPKIGLQCSPWLCCCLFWHQRWTDKPPQTLWGA